MKRLPFKMYLKRGCEVEYTKLHAVIWPETVKMIKENQGVSNYCVSWDKEISDGIHYVYK